MPGLVGVKQPRPVGHRRGQPSQRPTQRGVVRVEFEQSGDNGQCRSWLQRGQRHGIERITTRELDVFEIECIGQCACLVQVNIAGVLQTRGDAAPFGVGQGFEQVAPWPAGDVDDVLLQSLST